MRKAGVLSILFVVVLLAVAVIAEAQQPKSVPRIGFLSDELHPSDSRAFARKLHIEAFRQGLRELGYIEGKNILIEYRYAEGRFERLPALAEELVQLKVEIIVVVNSAVARGAKKATSTIPIVMANGSDPTQRGLAASFARPGGNVTGLTNYSAELLGKRLELLKEVVPKVSRFAYLNDPDSAASRAMFKDGQVAAQALGVQFQLVEVKTQDPDIEGAFRVMAKERIGALITAVSSLHRKRVLELVEKNRMPAIHPTMPWIDAGGLMCYGVNTPDLFRRAATFVDKILKGAKPADLPVEQPTKFEFGINLKTAKQLGLTIPQSVLYRADKVIR